MTLKPSAGTGTALSWFKSSYSGDSDSNECLEVAWQKSSYSNSNERDDCLEVAPTPSTIHIRDSKNPDGPQLHLRPSAWADFVAYAASEG
ncbi:toxin [Streptomyces platensis subsp. clarensis]|nr:toxin [Streptomyces platensis subsp. clarensis]